MNNFIEKLRQIQGSKSTTQFAIEMQLPPSTLSRIYSGSRSMGVEVLLKILKVYPELATALVADAKGTRPEALTA